MIDFAGVKAWAILDGKVKQTSKDGAVLWKGGYKNWVLASIEADGTPYNGGLGYKDGYRIRSGGAESASDSAACTGFIPCKAGDVIRFTTTDGKVLWTEYTATLTALSFCDSSKANLGQFTSQPAVYGIFENVYGEVDKVTKVNGVWQYPVINNSDIAFVRFTVPRIAGSPTVNTTGANLIVTINEEIT